MKNYDETIETVFQRMEEYKTVQKRKRRMVKRAAASLGCLCLVAAACFGLWKSGVLTKALPGHPGSGGNNYPGSLAETDISKTDKDVSVEKTAKKNAGYLHRKRRYDLYHRCKRRGDEGCRRDRADTKQQFRPDHRDVCGSEYGEPDRIQEEDNLENRYSASKCNSKWRKKVATDEFYYFDTKLFTELLTYDVSNPKKPILKGSVTQEGTYQTSRKIGNIVYLFTNPNLSRSNGDMDEATDTTDSNDWIPLVNGEAVTADCIYIPERGNNGLVISSVNIKEPGKVLDDILIVNDSARFLGTMAYFVTYRNMDPLFAVDLSDEKNPKVLSELKITGFSEYLHFWGEDKLVGIGYETDPETGRQTGLKISMFDISDPADLKVAGSCVLKNTGYSPALYDYKCVLVDDGGAGRKYL